MIELLKEIWTTVQRNKLRTSLTGFAVAWGIFMLIFLLGAGNGLINANMDQMNRFLTNSMMVFGGRTSKPYNGLKEGRRIELDNKDMHTTATSFKENVLEVGGMLFQSGITLTNGKNYVAAQSLTGVYPNSKEINKHEMLHGRFVNDIDIRDSRKVIVLSKDQAKELDRNYKNLVGRYIKVNNMMFLVVGI